MLRVLATFWIGLLCSATTPDGPDDVPSDLGKWIETGPPRGSRWRAANQDVKHEWVVALRDGHPQARLRGAKDEAPTPLPFDIEEGSRQDGLAGSRLSIKAADGWFVSFEAGEFGGTLWWFSPDGKERYKILEKARIHGFIATDDGMLALEGLAHLSSSEGRILRLTRAPGGHWQSEDFIDLQHAPETFAKAADGSLIVATTDRLLRILPADKKIEVLVDEVFWGGLYPNSMVITPAGVMYLGMRHGVAKVEKKDGSFRLRWLLPAKAPETTKRKQGPKAR